MKKLEWIDESKESERERERERESKVDRLIDRYEETGMDR